MAFVVVGDYGWDGLSVEAVSLSRFTAEARRDELNAAHGYDDDDPTLNRYKIYEQTLLAPARPFADREAGPMIDGTKYGKCPFLLDDGVTEVSVWIYVPGDLCKFSDDELARGTVAAQMAMLVAARTRWPERTVNPS